MEERDEVPCQLEVVIPVVGDKVNKVEAAQQRGREIDVLLHRINMSVPRDVNFCSIA